ncbi:dihydrodipicolinate synthase family protein [Vibrio harveyi]|uniref:dihydrodipicolinate synthase family protein n=1 Tax=Vibrio harveyi TaxID=669 RepID=UPI001EFE772C|nr:dihydrodipicolinate synthase family protein [Vibrio harveyi]MCG9611877.1 dihydrodipicolinate synthase family protein [Vibrio harveyi]MCG9670079.1 dihydrodipicolinate synthase family protein [Vibrio harveyi]
MKVEWKGVYPAVSTQFRHDQSIDLDATQTVIDNQIKDGVNGIICLGTVGENCALYPEEKRQVLQAAQEVVNGRVPLIAGTAESITTAAIDYMQDAQNIGIDGCMVMPAMVYRTSESETFDYYRTLAHATPEMPIMIYNNPVSYGVDVNLDIMAKLAEFESIVAVKESTTDTRRITELYNQFDDRFTVFSGVDDIALESLMLGATGWISGLTNVFPEESVAIYKLASQGRYAEALEIYRWFLPLLRLDTIPTLVQCIKLAEQVCGRGSEQVRAPRQILQGAEREQVIQLVEHALATRLDLTKYNL